MAKTLFDLIVAAGAALPTRQEFGDKMHDENISEEEKQDILEIVMDAGGYENLPED